MTNQTRKELAKEVAKLTKQLETVRTLMVTEAEQSNGTTTHYVNRMYPFVPSMSRLIEQCKEWRDDLEDIAKFNHTDFGD